MNRNFIKLSNRIIRTTYLKGRGELCERTHVNARGGFFNARRAFSSDDKRYNEASESEQQYITSFTGMDVVRGNVQPCIVKEDEHLLFAFKPPRVLSQRDRTGDESIVDVLQRMLDSRRTHENGDAAYLVSVHRLDRAVGGLMVFAKTPRAAKIVSGQFRRGTVRKMYWALVHGRLEASEGTLEHWVRRRRDGNAVAVFDSAPPTRSDVRHAVLSYSTLQPIDDKYTLLQVELRTGRKHQIRAQFARIGHAIVNDRLYAPPNTSTIAPRGRSAKHGYTPVYLVAKRLELEHPQFGIGRIGVELPPQCCVITAHFGELLR